MGIQTTRPFNAFKQLYIFWCVWTTEEEARAESRMQIDAVNDWFEPEEGITK
jgi:hypothetical protein